MSASAKNSKTANALPTADLAPTGRAKCIQCDEAIAKGSVRIAVEREVDTGTFVAKGAGYLHPGCAEGSARKSWPLGVGDLITRVQQNADTSITRAFRNSEATRVWPVMNTSGANSKGRFEVSSESLWFPTREGGYVCGLLSNYSHIVCSRLSPN